MSKQKKWAQSDDWNGFHKQAAVATAMGPAESRVFMILRANSLSCLTSAAAAPTIVIVDEGSKR